MSEILEIFSYPFVIRALIAGSLISICASVLGVILVLKHYSLIGHGLSEIGFASLSIASALQIPAFVIATPSVIIASFVIMFVSQKFKTAGDIAIAIASSFALALGISISSLTGGTSSTSSYLFGSVLAVSDGDLIFSVILSLTVMIIFVIFYNRLFLITYNEDYARSLGINTTLYQFIISILTALIIVSGMRITGTLLISGVIILPAVIAKNLASGFKKLVIISGIVSFMAFIAGLMISFVFNIPAGAGVILSNTAILIFIKIFRLIKKIK
ncbi:MAG: metal ABC transporter permease [Synergistaceae bacterium]|nr:metal ABC transporter permease [Synergistaceae bacterium]